MKLYRIANGQWAGTQAEARQMAKRDRTTWEQAEVPTDKAGLLDFLNQPRGRDVSEPTQPEIDLQVKAAASQQAERVQRSIDIDEEIGRADFPTACRLAEHILGRLEEHRRQIAGASQ